jgi:uncharacterized membrane protein
VKKRLEGNRKLGRALLFTGKGDVQRAGLLILSAMEISIKFLDCPDVIKVHLFLTPARFSTWVQPFPFFPCPIHSFFAWLFLFCLLLELKLKLKLELIQAPMTQKPLLWAKVGKST